jgi:hypothetical protein
MRMSRAVLVALCLALLLPATALGQGPRGGSAEDWVTVTGPVTVGPNQTVGDLIVIDGDVRVDGRVRGDLVAVNGDVRLSGTVGGDLITVAKRAVLTPGAQVGGDLSYFGERPVVPPGARVEGDVTRVTQITDPLGFVGFFALWLAVSVSALVLGLLMLWLAPAALDATMRAVTTRPWATIGWGVLLFFGLPILALLALITLVGAPLGVALGLALWPLYAMGYTTSAWLLGRRLLRPPRGRVLAFFTGLVILRVVSLVPWIGGVIWLVGTVVGLGALAVALWEARRAAVGAQPASA